MKAINTHSPFPAHLPLNETKTNPCVCIFTKAGRPHARTVKGIKSYKKACEQWYKNLLQWQYKHRRKKKRKERVSVKRERIHQQKFFEIEGSELVFQPLIHYSAFRHYDDVFLYRFLLGVWRFKNLVYGFQRTSLCLHETFFFWSLDQPPQCWSGRLDCLQKIDKDYFEGVPCDKQKVESPGDFIPYCWYRVGLLSK